jgi:ribosomal protein S18 acetylase RimI-like enzyme
MGSTDFREEHVLGDGQVIVLRYIQPADAAELRRAFLALSPETRYRRFFGAITDLDDVTLRYLTSVDGKNHVAIVATSDSLDLKTERGIGVARFVRSASQPRTAEAAVTVVDDMQRRGIGTHLTTALARAARERGIDDFRCEILESNTVVVRALAEAGATVVEQGSGVVVLSVPLSAGGALGRALRIAAEHVNAFLRGLLPPLVRP